LESSEASVSPKNVKLAIQEITIISKVPRKPFVMLLIALLRIISLVVIILLTVSQKDAILIPDLKRIHNLFRDPQPPQKNRP
jgi:hypothetical protein